MRPYGVLHFSDLVPIAPDHVTTLLLAGLAGSSGQAQDWLSSGSTATANNGVAGAGIVRFTGWSTAGSTSINFMVNLMSTAAGAPSSGTSISSSGVSHPVMGQATFQVPGGSTGFSVFAMSSGYVFIEQWRK